MSRSTLITSITLKSKDTPFRKYLEGCCENKIPIENSVYDCFCIWLSRFQGTNLVSSNEIDIDWNSVKNRQFRSFSEIERALTFSKKFVDGIVVKKLTDEIRHTKLHLFLEEEVSIFERWVQEYRINIELNLEDDFVLKTQYPLVKVNIPESKFHTMLPTDTPPPVALAEDSSFDLVSVSRVKGAKELDKNQLEALQKHIDQHASKEEVYLAEGTAIRFTQTLINYCQPNDKGIIVNKTGKYPNEYWVKNTKSVRKFSAVFNEHFEVLNSETSESESLPLLPTEILKAGTSVKFLKDSDYYYQGEIGTIIEAVTSPNYVGNYKIQTNIKGNVVIGHLSTDFVIVKDTK